jgi:hypothetical protein
MNDLTENPPFILREPQDERKRGLNHVNFSVHAEPVEAFIAESMNPLGLIRTILIEPFHVIGQRPPISAIDSHTIARSL